MDDFSGSIFQGEFDRAEDCFYLTQVKNLQTASILSEDKLNQLYNYLAKQNDSCMITVNDQIPILLTQQEVRKLLKDLDHIQVALQNFSKNC